MKIDKLNGFVPIVLAVIIGGSVLIAGGGGYTGYRYYNSNKLLKHARELANTSKFYDAKMVYERASRSWPSKYRKGLVEKASKAIADDEIYKQAIIAAVEDNFESCISSLDKINSEYPKYSYVNAVREQCRENKNRLAKGEAIIPVVIEDQAVAGLVSESLNNKTEKLAQIEVQDQTASANQQDNNSSTPKAQKSSGSKSNNTPTIPQAPQNQSPATTPEVDQSPPVIKHLGVSFGPYNSETGRAGAFLFAPLDRNPFLGFADVVSSPQGPKALPTFEYYVAPDATVYAIADTYVLTITYQNETGDYEIQTSVDRDGFNQYRVSYDHIKNLTFSEGDRLTAGQVIGVAGNFGGSFGRTEIMIYKNGITYCPFSFYDSALLASHQQLVSNLIADWETYKGDTGLYNETLYPVYVGCRQNTMAD